MRAIIDIMESRGVPGVSLGVLRDGEIETEVQGVLRRGDDAAVRPDTLFQAASISKLVTAVGVLQLVRTHGLDLDAPVNEVLTSWRLPDGPFEARRVTPRSLLGHTAGTSTTGFAGYAYDARVPTLRQVLDGAPPANSEPVRIEREPGAAHVYSGGGFCVLQQMLEDVTGRAFAAHLRERVLRPAGMSDSGFFTDLPDLPDPRAARHLRSAAAHRTDGSPVPGGHHRYPEHAAAGLWTTAADLMRFGAAVQRALGAEPAAEDPLLAPDAAHAMVAPVRPEFTGYGLGVGRFRFGAETYLGHSGSNEGFESLLVFHPTRPVGAAILTNHHETDAIWRLLEVVARRDGWPGFDPPRATNCAADTDAGR